uniref:Uncharacterized protein n=1 Tax=Anguilla anguilla TaxID=7936 RepID=A0A0E9PU04_ANGAN
MVVERDTSQLSLGNNKQMCIIFLLFSHFNVL